MSQVLPLKTASPRVAGLIKATLARIHLHLRVQLWREPRTFDRHGPLGADRACRLRADRQRDRTHPTPQIPLDTRGRSRCTPADQWVHEAGLPDRNPGRSEGRPAGQSVARVRGCRWVSRARDRRQASAGAGELSRDRCDDCRRLFAQSTGPCRRSILKSVPIGQVASVTLRSAKPGYVARYS
jgi:hypothetical protein